MGRTAAPDTILLKIYHSEYATWQGSINWVDRQKKQHFKSLLEMIKLMQNELGKDEEKDTG